MPARSCPDSPPTGRATTCRPTHGLRASTTFVISRFSAVHAFFGLGPVWLGLPLFIAGLVTIFRLGRPATAIAVTALWPEMLALSALKKYPFLDERTSTFLFAITVVVAAIGVAGLGSLLRPWLKGGVAAILAAAAAVAFTAAAHPYVRSHSIPHEDVRDQARYVATHAAPGDVILVNLSSNWGFAYYWPAARRLPGRPRRFAGIRGAFPGTAAHYRRARPEPRGRQRSADPGPGAGPAACLQPDLAGPHAPVGNRASGVDRGAAPAETGQQAGQGTRVAGGAAGPWISRRCRPVPGRGPGLDALVTAGCQSVTPPRQHRG